MKKYFILLLLSSSLFSMTPREALHRIVEGNLRYTKDHLSHADVSSDRRKEVVQKQNPFATIVGCSDSRVPPEIIFDEGIGDLFTVRVAGNVVGPVELDSIEYSVKVLGSALVIVLGHQSCGAVDAVFHDKTEDIEAIADLIKPAIQNARDLQQAVKENVRWTVQHLKQTPLIKKFMANGKVDVVGAYYHLGSGEVEFLKIK